MAENLKLFNEHSEYEDFIQTEGFVKPNVSYCIQENEVHYNKYDYSDRYLTFIALEDDSEFSFNPMSSNTISYSVDDGETWSTLSGGASTPSIDSGEKIIWKGEMISYMDIQQSLVGVGFFTSTKTFDVEGNVMSLLYGDEFNGENSLEGKDGGFAQLFMQTKVVNAKNLYLPTTLAGACYNSMFVACTNLITAPKLLATEMTSYYIESYSMYFGCYQGMFAGCTSLTTAPTLPATTLANSCYNAMFNGCTNLTTASELPATTLANSCYNAMFAGCTSLTTAPTLPATTLANSCYNAMFNGCTSLTTAPTLPATTLADSCYYQMFNGCTNLTTAPELPAITLVNNCYFGMFSGCTNLNYIKALFTTKPEEYYTGNWVKGVATSGTFVKNSAAKWNVTGNNGIPSGWVIQNNDNDNPFPIRDAVDLGLSVKWATYNVGATSEIDYGYMFSWGGISGNAFTEVGTIPSGIKQYSMSDYELSNGEGNYNRPRFTKYCPSGLSSWYYADGFTGDTLVTLESVDDAAFQASNGQYRMPTKNEYLELETGTTNGFLENGTFTLYEFDASVNRLVPTTSTTNFNGTKFSGNTFVGHMFFKRGVSDFASAINSGEYVFFPSAGSCGDGGVYQVDIDGIYWSSSLREGDPRFVWGLDFGGVNMGLVDGHFRSDGHSVRGVLNQ